MSVIAPYISSPPAGFPTREPGKRFMVARSDSEMQPCGLVRPNVIVRWAFYLSVFSIPFVRLYLPGSGERIGVTRLVQVLILCAVLSQPRVCIRLIPTALFWFLAYCALRVLAGLCLTPELATLWWPSTLEWLQFALPWLWVM